MDPSEIKNLDYEFEIIALSDTHRTHTLLIVPTVWLKEHNIVDPQYLYDNESEHTELYTELMEFPEINKFHSVLTY